MERITRDKVYYNHSASNEPGLIISPGQEFFAETPLNSGKWLKKPEDHFSAEKRTGYNPTVCVGVNGALPGDALIINILNIEPDELGYTGFDPAAGIPYAELLYPHNWGLTTKTVRIKNGFVEWSDKLKIKTAPMIGTLGTAPNLIGSPDNKLAGSYGGNMDVQEVCAGASIWLPVNVPNALLHIGDAHAIQGDGEICSGGGIECCATVKLRIDLVKKPASMNWVRIENKSHIMTVCCHRSLEDSFRLATRELIDWMVDSYGYTIEEAFLLLGQVMEARATQFVNPASTYICKIAKKFLE